MSDTDQLKAALAEPGTVRAMEHSMQPAMPAALMLLLSLGVSTLAAYVALETCNEDVPRDRLRGASPTATECP